MRYLLPIFASSALVAAAPGMKTVYDTTVVTTVQYVEESAATGGPAIPYFAAPVAPAPAASSASAPAPPAPAAPVASSSYSAPPAAASSQAATKPADSLTKPGDKDGQTTQGQATTQSSDSILGKMSAADVLKIVKTCWNGAIPWPVSGVPGPCVDVVAPQLSIFPRPATTANTMTINNYCGYDINYVHFDGPTSLGTGTIKSKSSLNQPFSGTVYKLSKANDPGFSKPALIEYGVGGGNVYYDLSLINCLSGGDTSACAGHEAGLQMGGAKAKTFQCAAGAWCDDQVYMYQENLCKKQNPVSASSASDGLTVDFCASMKH